MSAAGIFRSGTFALCSAVVALLLVFWAKGETSGDFLNWHRRPRALEIYSVGGLLRVAYGDLDSARYPATPGWEGTFWPFRRRFGRFEADLRPGTTLGFRYERWVRHAPALNADMRGLTVPYWFLVLCFAVPAILSALALFRARRRRRRADAGLCVACGYDLRASKGTCPECGAAIRRKLEAAE